MERIVCILIGYIFGLFQTGYLYGRMNHVDIRKMGSGNAGSTNALRTLGVKAGVCTFLGDSFKCIFAVLAVRLIFGGNYGEILPLLSIYAGLGAVLGHNFPFYLGFKGGKGIAAMAGLLAALTNLWITFDSTCSICYNSSSNEIRFRWFDCGRSDFLCWCGVSGADGKLRDGVCVPL